MDQVLCDATARLETAPDDAAALATIRAALVEPSDRTAALHAAARFLPEWPVQLVAIAPAEATLLATLWTETPVSKRCAFVSAVAAAGSAHLDALIDGARQLPRELASPLMMMLSPHLPDPSSGEILIADMLEHLRGARRDRACGERAERLLQRHELWHKRED